MTYRKRWGHHAEAIAARWSFNDRSHTTGFCSPGGTTFAFSTTRLLCGGCSGIGSVSGGTVANNLRSRSQLCLAATQPLQWAMAMSTGARARALRIEPAMMIPPEAS
jgi:hypothetical protein